MIIDRKNIGHLSNVKFWLIYGNVLPNIQCLETGNANTKQAQLGKLPASSLTNRAAKFF